MSDDTHRFRKLGGWLLCLVVVTFFDALSTFVGTFTKDGFLKTWPTYEGGELWFQLLIFFCTLYMVAMKVAYGVMIVKRDQRFVRTWQLVHAGNIISVVTNLVMHLVCGFPHREGPAYVNTFGYGLASDIMIFIPIPITLFLLTLYTVKSVRVRTYMGSDKYLRLAFFTRKAPGPIPAVPDEVVPDEVSEAD